MEKYFIDTNIFVYAYTKIEENKIKIAKNIIENGIISRNTYISEQILIEFINCISKKISKNITKKQILNISQSINNSQNVINYNGNTIIKALKISQENNIHFFDALIAATMIENNIDIIYSENEKDFKKIKGITIINPFK
jgi:predicted nucleic acid-binding protein